MSHGGAVLHVWQSHKAACTACTTFSPCQRHWMYPPPPHTHTQLALPTTTRCMHVWILLWAHSGRMNGDWSHCPPMLPMRAGNKLPAAPLPRPLVDEQTSRAHLEQDAAVVLPHAPASKEPASSHGGRACVGGVGWTGHGCGMSWASRVHTRADTVAHERRQWLDGASPCLPRVPRYPHRPDPAARHAPSRRDSVRI